jgi:hypothetical protein
MDVGLEINAEKAKYMLLSHHQNAGLNHDVKIANRSFESLVLFKYFGTTVTYQNFIREEIKRRMNACHHLFQNLLSPRLLSKNVNIRIYRIWPLVPYGCEI